MESGLTVGDRAPPNSLDQLALERFHGVAPRLWRPFGAEMPEHRAVAVVTTVRLPHEDLEELRVLPLHDPEHGVLLVTGQRGEPIGMAPLADQDDPAEAVEEPSSHPSSYAHHLLEIRGDAKVARCGKTMTRWNKPVEDVAEQLALGRGEELTGHTAPACRLM